MCVVLCFTRGISKYSQLNTACIILKPWNSFLATLMCYSCIFVVHYIPIIILDIYLYTIQYSVRYRHTVNIIHKSEQDNRRFNLIQWFFSPAANVNEFANPHFEVSTYGCVPLSPVLLCHVQLYQSPSGS